MPPDSRPPGSGWPRAELLRSLEARILAFGLGLAALTLLALGVGWLLNPGATTVFAAMTGLNLTIGRAAGMSFGYASGLTHPAVISSNLLVETIQVLVVYPLFVLSWNNLVDVRHMRRFLAGMRRSAEASQPRVARYGMIGLFAFVFLPFWMTGPVIGAIVGFLIGLKPRQNLLTVLSATCAAVLIWALLFQRMSELMADYGRYAVFGTVLVIAAAAIAVRSVHRWHSGTQPVATGDAPRVARAPDTEG